MNTRKEQHLKHFLVILLLVLATPFAASAQYRNADYDAYIEKYAPVAIEQMQRYHIPASITLAQGLLESAAGKSYLAKNGNNHFGIKCHDWQGRKQYRDDDATNECFRSYNSARESYEDHSKFLQKPRYARLFTYSQTDYKSWAHGLKACGYATSPTYAQSLISIIERYQLYAYDNGTNKNANSGNKKKKTPDNIPEKNYEILYNNGLPYVVAQSGDTYKTIAWNLDKSCRKLAKYNERDVDSQLYPGEKVYLKKKAKKADKRYKGMVYVVKPGDSMYGIAQHFGIRLKYLYKMNDLTPDMPIRIDQRLRVR